MIRGVVFDLGETLIRFSGDWPAIFRRSRQAVIDQLAASGYQLPEEEFSQELKQRIVAAQEIREEDFIERPTDQIFRELMAEFDYPDLAPEIVAGAMETLYAESEEHWLPVENLSKILDEIEEVGLRMGLISNASDVANVHRLIDKVEVRDYFDPILVSAGVGVRKPAPLIFQKLLHQWNLGAEQTVMIGDTLGADILGAKRLGMHQIWLKTAADRADNLSWLLRLQPEREADNLAEVPQLLRHWMEVETRD